MMNIKTKKDKHLWYLKYRRDVFNRSVRMGLKAQLAGADLTEWDLRGACLDWADLSNAQLGEANLNNASLKWANLSNAYMYRTSMKSVDAFGADFRGANMDSAYMKNANLMKANMREANLADAHVTGARFEEADIRHACLNRANIAEAFMTNTDMRGTSITSVPDSYDIIVDKTIAQHIAYLICRLNCEDEEFLEMKEALKTFANASNRTKEYGQIR